MSTKPQISRHAAEFPSHEVGSDEIFFSVTDDAGVITHVNSVFERLARSSREELIGSPHNIIRHPDMPGGVFKLMWDDLQSDAPFAGYVRNLARDNSTYDVMATVTPLPSGGYLSVRTRPVTENFDTAAKVYYEANDLEAWVKGEGKNRREAAALGAEKILEIVGTYRDFMYAIVPAELQALEEQGLCLPEGEGELYESVVALYNELDSFMGVQSAIADATQQMQEAGRALEAENEATARVKEEMESVVVDGVERTLLLAPLGVWSTMRGIIDEHVADLGELASQLADAGAEARFAIALARLHTAVTARFVAEEGHEEAIGLLIEALDVDIESMHRAVSTHARLARRVDMKVGSIGRIMEVPHSLIKEWDATDQTELAPGVGDLVREVQRAMKAAEVSYEQLQASSQNIGGDVDPARVDEAIDRVKKLADN
ncbi:PAS domain-containing protein [Corynebacterium breve]|uniref:PAS domain-containing protein n=1 Tax=Corynebacterium breve TaxID=3049799 RepID=A0ABY8VGD8_9CORY|nr:PAS domain-containing protein [Corynebacterium breve]WIM68167.1 PAS domain-containing protein [Corynebacterium breve]